jgi:hypothetical protein
MIILMILNILALIAGMLTIVDALALFYCPPIRTNAMIARTVLRGTVSVLLLWWTRGQMAQGVA